MPSMMTTTCTVSLYSQKAKRKWERGIGVLLAAQFFVAQGAYLEEPATVVNRLFKAGHETEHGRKEEDHGEAEAIHLQTRSTVSNGDK